MQGNTVFDPFVGDERRPATDIDDGGVLVATDSPRCRPLRVGDDNDGLRIEDNLLVGDEDIHVGQDAGRIELRRNWWLQTAFPDPFVESDIGDLRLTDVGQALASR